MDKDNILSSTKKQTHKILILILMLNYLLIKWTKIKLINKKNQINKLIVNKQNLINNKKILNKKF